MKKIPKSVHAYLDYGSAVLFLASPWIFLFSHISSAKWTALFVGALILILSLYTRYEGGVIKIIPMRMHLIMDIILGIFLALSPWLLEFSRESYLFHVLMGLSILLSGIMTKRYLKKEAIIVQEQSD